MGKEIGRHKGCRHCAAPRMNSRSDLRETEGDDLQQAEKPRELEVRYVKGPRQLCDNSAMTLAILLSLKSVESLENGLQSYSGATPLF